jgi:NTP pyrophosphatase (non-canonical NTP hydrolase)
MTTLARLKARPKTIMNTLEMVIEFHRKFVEEPGLPIDKIQGCRVSLLQEELRELAEAVYAKDRIEILDALTDLQYVLDGAYIAFGFDHVKQAAFEEVHRSNMSKLGADGKPIFREDGKVLKGPNYSPPNLAQFI